MLEGLVGLAVLAALITLPGPGGTLLHLFRDDLLHGDVLYMKRWVVSLFGLEVHVHHIKAADQARHMHDHPWAFFSAVLSGWYTHEWTYPGRVGTHTTTRRAGDMDGLPIELIHRIVEVGPEGAWTLVVTGPRSQPWGFWVTHQDARGLGLTEDQLGRYDHTRGAYWVDRLIYLGAMPGDFRNERVTYLGRRRA